MSTTLIARASVLCCLAGSSLAQDLLQEHHFDNRLSPAVSVVAAGDVNLDGVPDFAVGTPKDGRGKVRVISGASQLPLYTFVADAQTYELGSVLANLGDVDLDGIADLAVTANTVVRVYSLATGQALYTVAGTVVDRFGYALCGAGDVNGDGRADFAVGAPQVLVWGGGDIWHYAIQGPGFVQILSGLDGSLLRTLNGPAGKTGFGGSLANAGNLDGDAFDDLLVSHHLLPFVPGGNFLVTGFSGANGAAVVQAPIPYGSIVASVGDSNGDGVDDFAVGSRATGVRVISGNGGATLHAPQALGNYDYFGYSLARFDDLDGDGAPEILVGATQLELYSPYAPGEVGPGYVRVLSGRTGAALSTVVGNFPNQQLGTSVAAPGDLDGDGTPDMLVAAAKDTGDLAVVRAYSGREGFSAPTKYCVGDWNSSLARASIDCVGSPSLSANQLTLTLANAVPGQAGQLFCGTSVDARKFNLFQHPGMLCVGAPIRRIGLPQTISAGGTLRRAVDLGPTSPFTLGSTWYFQHSFHANPAQPNSSDALALTFTP